MPRPTLVAAFLLALMCAAPPMLAQAAVIDRFDTAPETRWRFFADTVMGGVSSGQVAFRSENGRNYARMTGEVSTANNGGFIQFRTDLADSAPEGTTGVRLVVRGSNGPYFVHLRTGGTLLPWQYYQAEFPVSDTWSEIRLPLSDFRPSGRMLRATPRADSLKSLGIVAFGRDHSARVDVAEVGFY
ncbi:CIA30 family protein [Sedimentitalea arenosa]|uniref:CIA30 family protein n=1 Tax=Sedimentitalea arenosa TaxID=2798803 RepID=A0A8J7LZP2_9RHOB|nr:CIA30 family protein [Arenibacterium arenosum]MBJ6371576.1 CIA30 family protein [Arenibacterium arenosum]